MLRWRPCWGRLHGDYTSHTLKASFNRPAGCTATRCWPNGLKTPLYLCSSGLCQTSLCNHFTSLQNSAAHFRKAPSVLLHWLHFTSNVLKKTLPSLQKLHFNQRRIIQRAPRLHRACCTLNPVIQAEMKSIFCSDDLSRQCSTWSERNGHLSATHRHHTRSRTHDPRWKNELLKNPRERNETPFFHL